MLTKPLLGCTGELDETDDEGGLMSAVLLLETGDITNYAHILLREAQALIEGNPIRQQQKSKRRCQLRGLSNHTSYCCADVASPVRGSSRAMRSARASCSRVSRALSRSRLTSALMSPTLAPRLYQL